MSTKLAADNLYKHGSQLFYKAEQLGRQNTRISRTHVKQPHQQCAINLLLKQTCK